MIQSQSQYSLEDIVLHAQQKEQHYGLFELESQRMLEVNLDGMVWIKMGSMTAYRGKLKFTREGILEHGIGKMLKKKVSHEGTQLTKVQGQGKMFLSDLGKKITILQLRNESLYVAGHDILAFEPTLKWDIRMMKKMVAMLSGDLFNVRFEGEGLLAITSYYDPMVLIVEPGMPVFTDPNTTIAWSGNLQPKLKTDISVKTFFGRGSGESLQMKFEGAGFVVVQPFQEIYTS
ncbi:AIM24 family protein [Planctomycetota bacterium]|nr:AIM24 family protein [Planctomycetota bacterium]